MTYQSPRFDALLNGIAEVEARYHKNNSNNPDRLRLLEILKAVRDFIWRQSQASPSPISQAQQDEWQAIVEGAYFCCIARADKESSIFGRSSLRDMLMEKANITETNFPTDGEKMKRAVKFYNFLRANEATFTKVFRNNPLNAKLKDEDKLCVRKLSAEIISPMMIFFDGIRKQASALARAIPTEAAIDSCPDLYLDYVTLLKKADRKPDNQERLFAAQFVTAVIAICKPDKDEQDILTRSHLTKLGAYLWGRETIDETYWVLSPSRSLLRRQIDEKLNSLHGPIRAVCLATFETFVMDKNTKAQIEEFGRLHYKNESLLNNIDLKMRAIPQTVERLLDHYRNTSLVGPAIMTAATVAALISSVPGQAIGMTVGSAVGEMDHMVRLKMGLGKVASCVMQNTCGQGASMGYKIADIIVNSTTAGVMGILFQMGAFAIGGLTGAGLAGLFIVLPVYGMQKIYMSDFWKHMEASDPAMAKLVNKDFIEAVLSLPPEVFEHKDDLKRIQYVTRGRLTKDLGFFDKSNMQLQVAEEVKEEKSGLVKS